MKLHRFYLGERLGRLTQHFGQERCWVQDKELLHQWHKVLRFRVNDELSLFDGKEEILYKIAEIKSDETALVKVTSIQSKYPSKHILLAWSLLKKDNNDWVMQKATELGVTHFVPMLTERSEKTGFNSQRATKIIIEAAEQCGRIDIPNIDEVRSVASTIHTYSGSYKLYVTDERADISQADVAEKTGILIGPEGGWTEKELALMKDEHIDVLALGNLTLRAETAAVVAATKLLGITP